MPKLPKSFGRRRSTANALEDAQITPVASPSFRVFERPDGGSKSFDGGVKMNKFPPKPAAQKYNDDNLFEEIKINRGSGASNSNTASTTDNSSRLSAASTAPSSTDLPNQDEWRSPHDKPFSDIPTPAVPRSSTGFSLKAAGHTFSFGRGKPPTPTQTKVLDEPPPLPPKDVDENVNRPRAVTSSSYASTATPPRLDENELGLNLGGDFSDMFSGFGKRKSAFMDVGESSTKLPNTESLSTGPTVPARSYAGNRANQPSPLDLDRSVNVSPSPYSWNSQHSHDGLITNSSPLQGPPVPRHGSPQIQLNNSPGYPPTRSQRPSQTADSGLRRNAAHAIRRQSTIEYGEAEDEDARLLKESIIAARQLTASPVDIRARNSWLGPLSKGQSFGETSSVVKRKEVSPSPATTTPRVDGALLEDNMFDRQITAAADLAHQYEQRSDTPPEERTPKNKVMTPAQFERYRQEQERLKSLGGQSKDDEDNEEDAYDDDDDEAEKQRQVAKQRRKQEAHMAVYRQQMMKVTGEASQPTGPPPARSSMIPSRSSPNLQINGSGSADDEEEDDEVPLAILAAHGFPNKNRPPSQLPKMSSNPNLRASSMLGAYPPPPQSTNGDTAGGGQGGRLPVFARNLPEDPYFGAGLVNASNREPLALGTGSGSVYGGSSRGLQPGGLVGVIATEERSRAMRRGSPNAAGEYGPPPSNGFNGMGMPPNMQLGRSMTMPNGMGPMGPMGPMGSMGPMGPMLTPGDQAQLEMAQQMQQFMQMQMQFMQMMTSNQGRPQSQGGPGPQMPGVPQMGNYGQQPPPQGLRPGSAHQRAMSMLDPNAAPWQQQMPRNTMYGPSMQGGGGYTPSIAPSERSNVGMPGRYRPVSHYAGIDNKSRTNTMSGAIPDWTDAKQGAATVKPVPKSGNASDEDDEEGWAAMKQKREKKKSIWRSKKDDGGMASMKDLWNNVTN